MFMFIARFLYIRILYVCKIRYVSYTIRYVFRMIRWVSYTKRYVSCTIWYASYTLRKLHAFNTLTGCISAFYGTGIKRLKNLKTHNYPTYIHPNIYFAYIFKEFVFTQFSPMAKRWQVACLKLILFNFYVDLVYLLSHWSFTKLFDKTISDCVHKLSEDDWQHLCSYYIVFTIRSSNYLLEFLW